jgi:Spy/CpxP family protein refolding chaperone
MKFSRAVCIAAVALSGLVPGNIMAQAEKKEDKPAAPTGPPTLTRPAPRPDALSAMAELLKLTEPQKEKIKPILEEQTKQIRALRDDKTIPRENRASKYLEIRQATHDKIKPILTPEQAKVFDKNRGTPPGSPRPAAPAPTLPEKK